MSKIEVTPRNILGYIMVAFALILWVIVIVSGMLMLLGTLQPIRLPNVGSFGAQIGIDVVTGIVLQLGIYAILVGIGYGLAKNGIDLIKASS